MTGLSSCGTNQKFGSIFGEQFGFSVCIQSLDSASNITKIHSIIPNIGNHFND